MNLSRKIEIYYLLPELCYRIHQRCQLPGYFGGPSQVAIDAVAGVSNRCIKHGFRGVLGIRCIRMSSESGTVRRVPFVVTMWPWQSGREGGEEVIERPGKDDVVVAVQQEHDNSAGVADTCGEETLSTSTWSTSEHHRTHYTTTRLSGTEWEGSLRKQSFSYVMVHWGPHGQHGAMTPWRASPCIPLVPR